MKILLWQRQGKALMRQEKEEHLSSAKVQIQQPSLHSLPSFNLEAGLRRSSEEDTECGPEVDLLRTFSWLATYIVSFLDWSTATEEEDHTNDHEMTSEAAMAMAKEDPRCRDGHSFIKEDRSCCARLCLRPNPSVARYIYALIFLVTSLLAWTLRDYGHTLLSELRRLKGCHGARYCLGAEGVLRISFGSSMFFFVLFATTAGTKKLGEARNSWHSEWWGGKMLMWMGFMAVPFFLPSEFFRIYGKIAHVGAGVFLIIQLISVISFITWLNDYCHSEKYAERCHIQVMAISISAYVASIVGCIMMYVWYAPKLSCKLNILFITLTLLLLQIMSFVSVHPKVRAGYLAPGLMGAYIVFLCWCAIRSEPQTEICNQKAEIGSDWLTILSFIVAILVIVAATFSTGIDSRCFQLKKTEGKSEDDVPYGYGFFHFVFAMGSMYFGMLFISWDVHRTMQKWTIDVGWASTWVRVVNEWLAAVIYIWMLVAPLVWKRRAETT